MNVARVRLCLSLHALPSIEDKTLSRLLLQCGGPEGLLQAGLQRWRDLGLSHTATRALQVLDSPVTNPRRGGPGGIDVEAQVDALAACNATIIAITDSSYPPLLREIYDPPPLLYVRGSADLLAQPQLAVVGSRRASAAGLRGARTLSAQAVAAGLHISSGLALGIDSAAHRGALDCGGKTVAVMATGIDRVYPARHAELACDIERSGCLISEFPPGMQPLRHHFPRRNRIISGLALGVLVVEAALPSGSLITAGTALEQGREVFALPWSIFHQGGAGCLRLLRDGATMVESVADVLAELGPLFNLQRELFTTAVAGNSDDGTQSSSVLEYVGFEVVTLDELVDACGLPASGVMADLSALELAGKIQRVNGGYCRC